MTDIFRPLYHFSPPANWMNDPNGMVWHNGEYHLFYQYHPFSDVWGPMHWGHAVSTDLIRWSHLDVAIAPDEIGMIFSGSAVVDHCNSAGFGEGSLVSAFTYYNDGRQAQAIAFSNDAGRTWNKYHGNPVLPFRNKGVDFRDPKIIWYFDHWVMLIAAKDRIQFYTSKNLRQWQYSGEFGGKWGCNDGVWETPDLFQLPIEGTDEHVWVLTVGVGEGYSGGSGSQYFIGIFDGSIFTCTGDPEEVRWIDRGADFYAPQSFSNEPNGRRIIMAWMSNWRYAASTPSQGWRGAMTLPRQIKLRYRNEDVVLIQQPVLEFSKLPHVIVLEHYNTEAEVVNAALNGIELVSGHIDLRIDMSNQNEPFAVGLRTGPGRGVWLRVEPSARTISIDRTTSCDIEFHSFFPAIHLAEYVLRKDGLLNLQIYLDACSVELFCQDGETVITDLVFPPADCRGICLVYGSGALSINYIKIVRIDL